LKDLYFAAVQFLTMPNTMLARLRFRRRNALRLHLGCGLHYLPGMINIDGNLLRKKDLWLDLRNPLPFPDRSASLIYCAHTIEHLFPDDAIELLKEMRRVISDDGVVRLAVPSMEYALAIARGEVTVSWPREFRDPLAQAINYLFCDGQHKYGYSWIVLADFAAQAGFTRVSDISNQQREKKQYGPIVLGPELTGSLVAELQR
ncbi:MAG: methyltransferase domain-containing protein, partial [Phycisphaerales bacterium]|nr:methyltransferase domain-containing protein [Phycisphaerales bacterium]